MLKRERIIIKKKLPRGAIKTIAQRIGKDASLISRIIKGTRSDNHGVFLMAEQICKEAIKDKIEKERTIKEIAKTIKEFSS
jgi:hypothetical protein